MKNTNTTKADAYSKTGKCCICGGQYLHYGCNPAPLNNNNSARCCHECDKLIVIPLRGSDPKIVKQIKQRAKNRGITISEFLGNPLKTMESGVHEAQDVVTMTAENLVQLMKAKGLTKVTVGFNFSTLLCLPGNRLAALGFVGE